MFCDSEYLNFFEGRIFNLSPMEKQTNQAFQKAFDKYGNYYTSNCIRLDEGIRKITEEIDTENKKIVQNKFGDIFYRDALLQQKTGLEASFKNSDCRNKLELKTLVEGGKVLTESAIRQERDVLKKSEKEQYVYIVIGGSLLLVALYLITRK
jgi:hypothetical protein